MTTSLQQNLKMKGWERRITVYVFRWAIWYKENDYLSVFNWYCWIGTGWPMKKLVLFKCDIGLTLVPSGYNCTRIDNYDNIVEVKNSIRYQSYDPFIYTSSGWGIFWNNKKIFKLFFSHNKQPFKVSLPLGVDTVVALFW